MAHLETRILVCTQVANNDEEVQWCQVRDILKATFTRYEAVFEVDVSNRRIEDESEVI